MLSTDSHLSGKRKIPAEIVHEIFRHLSHEDGVAFSKTNRFLRSKTPTERKPPRWMVWPPRSSVGPCTKGEGEQFTIKGTEFSIYLPYTEIPAIYETSEGLKISIGTPIELGSLQVKSLLFRQKAFDPPWDDDFSKLSASQKEERFDTLMTQWRDSFSRSRAEHLITEFPGGTPDTTSFEMYSLILAASGEMKNLDRISFVCGQFVSDFFLNHVVRMDLEPQEPFPNVTRVDIIISQSEQNSMNETYSLLQNATFSGKYVGRNTWLSARGVKGGVKIYDPDRTTLKLYPSEEDTEGPALRIPPGFIDLRDLSASEVSEWASKPKVTICFQSFDLDSETEGPHSGIGEPDSSGTEAPESETEEQENENDGLSLEARKSLILVQDSEFDGSDFEEDDDSL